MSDWKSPEPALERVAAYVRAVYSEGSEQS